MRERKTIQTQQNCTARTSAPTPLLAKGGQIKMPLARSSHPTLCHAKSVPQAWVPCALAPGGPQHAGGAVPAQAEVVVAVGCGSNRGRGKGGAGSRQGGRRGAHRMQPAAIRHQNACSPPTAQVSAADSTPWFGATPRLSATRRTHVSACISSAHKCPLSPPARRPLASLLVAAGQRAAGR